MNSLIDELHDKESLVKIIESLLDNQKDLVFVFYKNELVLFNKASKIFFGINTPIEFLREYGNLEHRFMPHDYYFHPGKIEDSKDWIEALYELSESKRIVSMLNHKIKPHAFSVDIKYPFKGCEIVYFSDITTELIKRIMTENHTNMDNETNAYNRNYFEHISSQLVSAAIFNEKLIGVSLVEFNDEELLTQQMAQKLKNNIRSDDMLIRWNKKSFLLLFFLSEHQHVHFLGKKVLSTLEQSSLSHKVSICSSVQNDKESLDTLIQRCESQISENIEKYVII